MNKYSAFDEFASKVNKLQEDIEKLNDEYDDEDELDSVDSIEGNVLSLNPNNNFEENDNVEFDNELNRVDEPQAINQLNYEDDHNATKEQYNKDQAHNDFFSKTIDKPKEIFETGNITKFHTHHEKLNANVISLKTSNQKTKDKTESSVNTSKINPTPTKKRTQTITQSSRSTK